MQDFHDDGEGGAGIKIMHLLQDSNVRNVLVIVSRWYGGILLGPARFMYITDAARGVLEQGGYLQQPRALALTNTAADLAPMEQSSSSEGEAEVGISLQHAVTKPPSSFTKAGYNLPKPNHDAGEYDMLQGASACWCEDISAYTLISVVDMTSSIHEYSSPSCPGQSCTLEAGSRLTCCGKS